ncbi:MAG: glutathione S-transferase [Candidatus Methylopumilus sp.]|jgi:glutathione S-transferase|nr:glutathione S-transferase [Candidatus Methylopumilus sp.]
MKLLYSKTSPYARKVRIIAAEKHITLELQEVVLAEPDNPVPDFNPLGKIPVLIMDDGEPLYDSSVIVDYLEQRTPVAHLLPQDTRMRFQVKRWEALSDGVCDAAVSAMMERRRAENLQDPSWIARQMTKVERGLSRMEADLGDRSFCVGESMTLADIALGCVMAYLNLRYPELDFDKKYPKLAKHYARMMQRPSFQETAPPPV